MRLAIIVTEYPKTSETFILRDVMAFLEAGADIRLYHIAPYRHGQLLHDFAAPTKALARTVRPLSTRAVLAALKQPGTSLGLAARIIKEQGPEPVLAAKSVGIIPMAMAIGEELLDWGADHIHAEFAGHPATAAWVISRATGLPYSVSCRAHDIFRTQRLLAQKLGEAAFVRTISEFGKRFLQERVPSVPASRYQVIHSSVDPASIPALDPPATDPFHIVYVGSLEAKKGVGILLRALKDLPFDKWHCSIGGGGPDRTGLEVQTNELGLSDKVRFLGPLDIAGVMDLYAGASVVVAPSIIGPGGRAEGIPNVMIEALACQRPAISTAISGIPELIETGRTGLLVEPGSPEQLAEAITQIHGDPAKAFEMAAAGRAKVEAEFSLPVNTRRQLDLFAQHSANRPAEAA